MLSGIARHVTNEETALRLLRHVVNEELDKKRDRMFEKLGEMLTPYKRLHPITYHPSFATKVERIQKMTSRITTYNRIRPFLLNEEGSDDGDGVDDEDFNPEDVESEEEEVAEGVDGCGDELGCEFKAASKIWASANAYYQVCSRRHQVRIHIDISL